MNWLSGKIDTLVVFKVVNYLTDSFHNTDAKSFQSLKHKTYDILNKYCTVSQFKKFCEFSNWRNKP